MRFLLCYCLFFSTWDSHEKQQQVVCWIPVKCFLLKNNSKWCVEYLSSISYWKTTASGVLNTCQVFPTDKQQQVVCWIPVKYFLLTNNSKWCWISVKYVLLTNNSKWCVAYLSSISYWQATTSGVLNTCQVFPTDKQQQVLCWIPVKYFLLTNNSKWCWIPVKYFLLTNKSKWCWIPSIISYWQTTASGVEYLQVFPTDKQQQVVCWIPVKYFLLTNNSKWCWIPVKYFLLTQ